MALFTFFVAVLSLRLSAAAVLQLFIHGVWNPSFSIVTEPSYFQCFLILVALDLLRSLFSLWKLTPTTMNSFKNKSDEETTEQFLACYKELVLVAVLVAGLMLVVRSIF